MLDPRSKKKRFQLWYVDSIRRLESCDERLSMEEKVQWTLTLLANLEEEMKEKFQLNANEIRAVLREFEITHTILKETFKRLGKGE